MPIPPLFDPPANKVHAASFRVVDGQLRADPQLARLVKVFRSWRGEVDDAADWAIGDEVGVRLSPAAGPSYRETERDHQAPIVVRIECFVASTNADDPLNLWDAIVEALYPGDGSLRAAFEALGAGAYGDVIDGPAFGHVVDDGGDAVGWTAVGLFRVMILQSTPPMGPGS